jgi:hypothetical protein
MTALQLQLLEEKQKAEEYDSVPDLASLVRSPQFELATAICEYSEVWYKDTGEWIFRIMFGEKADFKEFRKSALRSRVMKKLLEKWRVKVLEKDGDIDAQEKAN